MAQIVTPATRASQVIKAGRCATMAREAAAAPNPCCPSLSKKRRCIRISLIFRRTRDYSLIQTDE